MWSVSSPPQLSTRISRAKRALLPRHGGVILVALLLGLATSIPLRRRTAPIAAQAVSATDMPATADR